MSQKYRGEIPALLDAVCKVLSKWSKNISSVSNLLVSTQKLEVTDNVDTFL